MLEHDLFRTERVCVVVDEFDKHPDRLHLDTVFGLLDKKNVIVSDDIIGRQSKIFRSIVEYTYNHTTSKYEVSEKGTEFTFVLLCIYFLSFLCYYFYMFLSHTQ